MISAKIHHDNSGNSQEGNPESLNASLDQNLADHFVLASKYYAEARNCMARGDMHEANAHLTIAMDYASFASDDNDNRLD